ncbi:hypothetical protein D9615_010022 [Tricholomella constricta]|uniref:Uncharacterized protein n=1 Tax=Tricholomella constricta TaxID=117010 RepID=A0A8H5GTW0_9AGAR|nr:hypothetical protein D9615_010022 [Tricholomella constricta]
MRDLLRNTGLTNEQAIDSLREAWVTRNNQLRDRWTQEAGARQAAAEAAARQLQEQQQLAEQQRRQEEQRQQQAQQAQPRPQNNHEGNEQQQQQEQDMEEERPDRERHAKAKLRTFDPNLSVASVIVPRPSSKAARIRSAPSAPRPTTPSAWLEWARWSFLVSASSASVLRKDFDTAKFKLGQFAGTGFTNCVSPCSSDQECWQGDDSAYGRDETPHHDGDRFTSPSISLSLHQSRPRHCHNSIYHRLRFDLLLHPVIQPKTFPFAHSTSYSLFELNPFFRRYRRRSLPIIAASSLAYRYGFSLLSEKGGTTEVWRGRYGRVRQA